MDLKTIQDIPVESIVCRKQVREQFDQEKLAGLAQSIREQGVLQPLLVHREGELLVLDDGERRLRAAKLAGLKTVPVIVTERQRTPAEVLQLQLVANCQRVDISPMEKAKAIRRLLAETQWTAAQAAVKLGESPANISKALSLLLLSPAAQEAVANGKLHTSTAYELAKLPDAELREKLAAEAVEKRLTRATVIERTRAAGTSRPPAKPRAPRTRPERVVFPLGDGRSITVAARECKLDLLVAWMEDLLARIKAVSGPGRSLADVAKAIAAGGK